MFKFNYSFFGTACYSKVTVRKRAKEPVKPFSGSVTNGQMEVAEVYSAIPGVEEGVHEFVCAMFLSHRTGN